MKNTFETSPRPGNPVIGYVELARILKRSAGGLRTSVNRLPLQRWQVARVVVWDRNEVEAYIQAKQNY